MNLHHQTLIIPELARLESLGYVGLLGCKYVSPELTTPDSETGCPVRAINVAPAKGWAIVAWGPPGGEVKFKFLRDMAGRWHYDGVEKVEMVH